MARRRLIDPGIWISGHFKRLTLRRRLLFIGLISHADDEGKLKGEPVAVRSVVYPFDLFGPKTIEEDLQALEEEGLIQQYEVDGDRYILLRKWGKYQKPSHPTPSKIPDPPSKTSGEPPETLQSNSGASRVQGSVVKDRVGQGSVVQVRQGGDGQAAGSAPAPADASAEPAESNMKSVTCIESQGQLALLLGLPTGPELRGRIHRGEVTLAEGVTVPA